VAVARGGGGGGQDNEAEDGGEQGERGDGTTHDEPPDRVFEWFEAGGSRLRHVDWNAARRVFLRPSILALHVSLRQPPSGGVVRRARVRRMAVPLCRASPW
jgi:hypothetical protein